METLNQKTDTSANCWQWYSHSVLSYHDYLHDIALENRKNY